MKAPGFGDNKRANLEDLAILTGAEVRQLSQPTMFLVKFAYYVYLI